MSHIFPERCQKIRRGIFPGSPFVLCRQRGGLRRGFGRCAGFGSAPGFALVRGAVAGFRFAAGLARGGGRFSVFGLARGIGVTHLRPLDGAPASGIGLFFVIGSGVTGTSPFGGARGAAAAAGMQNRNLAIEGVANSIILRRRLLDTNGPQGY